MIRQVTLNDYEAIHRIKYAVGIDRARLEDSDYRFHLQTSGFLLYPDYERTDFDSDLQKTFLVHTDGNTIAGYVRIDTEPELKTEGAPYWFRTDMEEIYYTQPHADLGGIAVSPNAKHKGIGSSLLRAVEIEVRKKAIPYLFSFVVISPITNMPSLLFHEKNGFERIAVVTSQENFELKNYQSIMYGKKL